MLVVIKSSNSTPTSDLYLSWARRWFRAMTRNISANLPMLPLQNQEKYSSQTAIAIPELWYLAQKANSSDLLEAWTVSSHHLFASITYFHVFSWSNQAKEWRILRSPFIDSHRRLELVVCCWPWKPTRSMLHCWTLTKGRSQTICQPNWNICDQSREHWPNHVRSGEE